MDAGNFTGLGKTGMRRRMESLSSAGMAVFSVVLVVLMVLAWLFL